MVGPDKDDRPGFTIIEVVLVLAIAGLIFLIVFLALPALQRNQRDTQRRSGLGRIITRLENYKVNNNGNYPLDVGGTEAFEAQYLDDTMIDPTTGNKFNMVWSNATPANLGDVHFATSRVCNATGDGLTVVNSYVSRGLYAVVIKLESGGFYCQDNE